MPRQPYEIILVIQQSEAYSPRIYTDAVETGTMILNSHPEPFLDLLEEPRSIPVKPVEDLYALVGETVDLADAQPAVF